MDKDMTADQKHIKKKMTDELVARIEELEEEKKNLSVADFNARKAAEEASQSATQPKVDFSVIFFLCSHFSHFSHFDSDSFSKRKPKRKVRQL